MSTDTGTVTDDSMQDMRGRLVQRVERVTDDTPLHTVTTKYAYGPFGVLEGVLDTRGNLTRMEYDIRGRRTLLRDPDAGDTTETYDAFDQLFTQKTANNQVTTQYYDPLGRMFMRTAGNETSLFAWDTAANGVGLIGGTQSSDGVKVTYEYAGPGQNGGGERSSESWTVGGVDHRLDFEYDSVGRQSIVRYPAVGDSRYGTCQQG